MRLPHYRFANCCTRIDTGLWKVDGTKRLYLYKPKIASEWYVAMVPTYAKTPAPTNRSMGVTLSRILGPFPNATLAYDFLTDIGQDYIMGRDFRARRRKAQDKEAIMDNLRKHGFA